MGPEEEPVRDWARLIPVLLAGAMMQVMAPPAQDGIVRAEFLTMIVVSLVIAAVSLLLSELLRPKPDLESQRRPGIGQFQFPTAIEERVVPIIFGTVKLAGPNVVWYGDLRSKKIQETIKTGLWSSKTITTGFEHSVGIQFGLCRGPIDGIKRIWIGDDVVYDGALVADGPITIDNKKLFGGDKFGAGGVKGTLRVHPGNETQVANTYISGVQNPAAPHRGTCYAVWERGYIGNSTQIKPWAFEARRIPNGLGLTGGQELVNGSDANPAAVIYEYLTNTDWGLGLTTGDVDVANLQAAGATLFAEGNGFSFVLDRTMEGQELLRELERQIDGIVHLDQRTGKFRISLARGGYSIGALFQIDATCLAEVRDFTRGTWEETANQVSVSFSDRARDYFDTSARAEDLANQRMQGGEIIAVSRAYPGVKDRDLANQLASRELRHLSVPLAKADVVVSRAAFDVRPGDVVALTDPNNGISQLPMRVARIGYGELRENRISMGLIEDVFRFEAPFSGRPDTTLWAPPAQDVTGIAAADQRVFEAPWAIVRRDPRYPGVGDRVWAGGRRQTGAEVAFRIWQRSAVGPPSGAFDEDSDDVLQFLLVGTLKDAIVAGDAAGTATIGLEAGPDTLVDMEAAFTKGVAAIDVGQNLVNLIRIDDEFIGVSNVVNQGTHLDLTGCWRGMLDTIPEAHADAAKVYLLFAGGDLNDSSIASGRTVDVQLRPSSLTDEATEAESTTIQLLMADRVRKPYPPAQLRQNGAILPATSNFDALKTGGVSLDDRGIEASWIRRDYRTLDETQGITTDAEEISSDFPAFNGTEYRLEIFRGSESLLTGLQAYWKLDEQSGTRQDSSPNDRDLTDINTVGFAAGTVGNAANFSGDSDERLEASGSGILNFGDANFLIAGWFRFSTAPTAGQTIMGKWGSAGNRAYRITFASGVFAFEVSGDGTGSTQILHSSGIPATNTWHFVACWHDATNNRIYIQLNNGAVFSAAHTTGVFSGGSGIFMLGQDPGLTNQYQGRIDETGAWNRILTPAERTDLYNSGVGTTHPFANTTTLFQTGDEEGTVSLRTNLRGSWNLNEGGGKRFDDTTNDEDLDEVNTVGAVPGKLGNAAKLVRASGEFLQHPLTTRLAFGDADFTICAWIMLDSKASNRGLVGKWNAQDNNRSYLLQYVPAATDRYGFNVSGDGTAQTSITATAFGSPPTGVWHFLVAWHDSVANTINIQVNNGTINSAAHTTGAFSGSTAPFRIGAFIDGSSIIQSHDGLIDGVNVWGRVLTAQERTLLYNNGAGREAPLSPLFKPNKLQFASRTKILRKNFGAVPTSQATTKVTTRHEFDGVVREATKAIQHLFGFSGSVLDDDVALGVLAQNDVSFSYVAPTTGTYTFSVGRALPTGAVQARLNGGAFSSVILAGTLSGTLAVTAGDLVEVRHTEPAIDGSETILLVDAPSSTADAFGVLTF